MSSRFIREANATTIGILSIIIYKFTTRSDDSGNYKSKIGINRFIKPSNSLCQVVSVGPNIELIFIPKTEIHKDFKLNKLEACQLLIPRMQFFWADETRQENLYVKLLNWLWYIIFNGCTIHCLIGGNLSSALRTLWTTTTYIIGV